MSFAVVKFTNEDDAPGIISTNWYGATRKTCYYPNVVTEARKNAILMKRKKPTGDWDECCIKVVKEYDTYKAAKFHLTNLEDTLHSDTESEIEIIACKRKRKPKIIRLPGEDSSGEEQWTPRPKINRVVSHALPSSSSSHPHSLSELHVSKNLTKDPSQSFLTSPGITNDCLPSQTSPQVTIIKVSHSPSISPVGFHNYEDIDDSQAACSQQQQTISSPYKGTSSEHHQGTYSQSHQTTCSQPCQVTGVQHHQVPCSQHQQTTSIHHNQATYSHLQTPCLQHFLPCSQHHQANCCPTHQTTCFSHHQTNEGSALAFSGMANTDLKSILSNQQLMMNTLQELTTTINRVEQKFDALKHHLHLSQSCPQGNLQIVPYSSELNDGPFFEIISELPLNHRNFDLINEKLAENPELRKKLLTILMTASGKDMKNTICNILRKLLVDELAETFSLTGRFRNGFVKKVFETTEMFKLITEICFKLYKGEAKEKVIRDSVSDWLMQSKFRRTRRESRHCEQLMRINYSEETANSRQEDHSDQNTNNEDSM